MGPFYPVETPLGQDAELTPKAAKGGRAEGRMIGEEGASGSRAGRDGARQPDPGILPFRFG